MQNQERILTIIDVRGRRFEIPAEPLIEANHPFLGKVQFVEEESIWNAICYLPDDPEGVETMVHFLLHDTFDIPEPITADGRELEYLVHVTGIGDQYAVDDMAERAYHLFTEELHRCTSPERFALAVRTLYTTYPRSGIHGPGMIVAMKKFIVYFSEPRIDAEWIQPARFYLFATVDGFEEDYQDAMKEIEIVLEAGLSASKWYHS